MCLDVLGQNVHGQITKFTHFIKASQMQERVFMFWGSRCKGEKLSLKKMM